MNKSIKTALISSLLLIAALLVVFWAIVPSVKMNSAKAMFSEGKFSSGADILSSLDSFPYVSPFSDAFINGAAAAAETLSVGDSVFFGRYEQDNNTENGEEEIEWQVLSVENGKMLLISRKILDVKTYTKFVSAVEMQWEYSFIREWLCGEFFESAFSESEAAFIAEETIDNPVNEGSGAKQGNDTVDKVFLLSSYEAERYFASDSDRICEATPFAKSRKDYVEAGNGKCMWWTRTLGRNPAFSTVVYSDGSILRHGVENTSRSVGVRPAIWIEM